LRSEFLVLPLVRKVIKLSRNLVFRVLLEFYFKWP
jgi:hypothetical protein